MIEETKWQLQFERKLFLKVGLMKTSEFRRFLASIGARFDEGAKHTKVYLNGKQTTLPRHQEIGEGLRLAILRQLSVKQKR